MTFIMQCTQIMMCLAWRSWQKIFLVMRKHMCLMTMEKDGAEEGIGRIGMLERK